MKTKEEVLSMWNSYTECPDFSVVLEEILNDRDKMIEALKFYGNRNNWSKEIMRQGRLVFMPKNVVSIVGPTLAEDVLR